MFATRCSISRLYPYLLRGLRLVGLGLLYVIAFVAMHPRLLSGKWFLGWDALRDHWGNIVYTTHLWSAWQLPLWAPHEQGGYFFLADPQAAPLYPINWLFALITPLAGEGLWVILVHSLLHYAIAGTGMHYLLKEFGVGLPGRTMGGLAFVISPRMAKAKDTSWHWSFAWTPWIFLAGYRLCKQPSVSKGLVFGLVTGVAFLAGYPPSWIRLLLLLAPIFALWSVWQLRQRGNRARYCRRWLGSLALAIAVCAALAAPVVLSTLVLFPLTDRAQMTLASVLLSSLHPQQLTTFVAAFAADLAYPGIMATMLAVFALRWRGVVLRPALRWLLGALTLVFFLLACGGRAFLLPLALKLFPPLSSMRIAEHYLFVVVFLTSLLAGIGLDGLCRVRPGKRLMPILLCAALAVVSVAAICWVFYAPLAETGQPRSPTPEQFKFALLSAVVCAAWLCIVLVSRPKLRAILVWVVPVLFAVDLSQQADGIYKIFMRTPDRSAEGAIEALRPKGNDLYRIADDGVFRYRVGQRHQIRELFGEYSMLMRRRTNAYNKLALRAPALLALANVRHFASNASGTYLRRHPQLFERSGPKLLAVKDPAPFAYFTNRLQLLASKEAVLTRMSQWHPGQPWPVLVDRADLEGLGPVLAHQISQLAARPPDLRVETKAQLRHYERNSLQLDVMAAEQGVLLINEDDFPGWRATVDGRPSPLFRANYRFRALVLGPGQHRVRLDFRPQKVIYALYLFWLVLAAIVVFGLSKLCV